MADLLDQLRFGLGFNAERNESAAADRVATPSSAKPFLRRLQMMFRASRRTWITRRGEPLRGALGCETKLRQSSSGDSAALLGGRETTDSTKRDQKK
jgi:hypothetical protein